MGIALQLLLVVGHINLHRSNIRNALSFPLSGWTAGCVGTCRVEPLCVWSHYPRPHHEGPELPAVSGPALHLGPRGLRQHCCHLLRICRETKVREKIRSPAAAALSS